MTHDPPSVSDLLWCDKTSPYQRWQCCLQYGHPGNHLAHCGVGATLVAEWNSYTSEEIRFDADGVRTLLKNGVAVETLVPEKPRASSKPELQLKPLDQFPKRFINLHRR